jgi:hypothetical protein
VFCSCLEFRVFVSVRSEGFRRVAQCTVTGVYLDSVLKHKCVLCAARLTDGTHTSFNVTVGGHDEAPVGPAQPVYRALKQMEAFYRLYLGCYVTHIHWDD